MAFMVNGILSYANSDQCKKAIPLLRDHKKRCLADEPGTLRFEFGVVRDDPTRIILQELYEDEAAFGAHWNGESMKIIGAESEQLGIEVKIEGLQGKTM